jgi:putative transposase
MRRRHEETDCLAWALLSNHFHILLRVKDIPLSIFMRRLLTGYPERG